MCGAVEVPRQILGRGIGGQRKASDVEILFVAENLGCPEQFAGPFAEQIGIREVAVDVRVTVVGGGDVLRETGHRDDVVAAYDEEVAALLFRRRAAVAVVVGEQTDVLLPGVRRCEPLAGAFRRGVAPCVVAGVEQPVADAVAERLLRIGVEQPPDRLPVDAEFSGECLQVGEDRALDRAGLLLCGRCGRGRSCGFGRRGRKPRAAAGAEGVVVVAGIAAFGTEHGGVG